MVDAWWIGSTMHLLINMLSSATKTYSIDSLQKPFAYPCVALLSCEHTCLLCARTWNRWLRSVTGFSERPRQKTGKTKTRSANVNFPHFLLTFFSRDHCLISKCSASQLSLPALSPSSQSPPLCCNAFSKLHCLQAWSSSAEMSLIQQNLSLIIMYEVES